MGKFVMKTNEKGSRFVLKAGNGEIIGVSETYSSESACKNGVESVRKNAAAAGLEDQTVEGSSCKNPKFEVYKDKAGEFRFRLRAANGKSFSPARATRPRPAASRASRASATTPPSPRWSWSKRKGIDRKGTAAAVPFSFCPFFFSGEKKKGHEKEKPKKIRREVQTSLFPS